MLADHRSIPGLCERFEAFVCKKEICNGTFIHLVREDIC